MRPRPACLCCEVEDLKLGPIEALAYGLGARMLTNPVVPIGDQVCEKHRTPMAEAMRSVMARLLGPFGRSP